MADHFDLEKELEKVSEKERELGDFLKRIYIFHKHNKRTPNYAYKNEYKEKIYKSAKKILDSSSEPKPGT